jgi:hypothetical protein
VRPLVHEQSICPPPILPILTRNGLKFSGYSDDNDGCGNVRLAVVELDQVEENRMKRWTALATLGLFLGAGTLAKAADFPVTTQSTQSRSGKTRSLFGRGGLLFPWVGGGKSNGNMSNRNAKRSSFGLDTSRANARGTRDATNVMPNLDRMFGRR